MKSIRQTVLLLVLIALPTAPWAGLLTPCVQNSNPAVLHETTVATNSHHDGSAHSMVIGHQSGSTHGHASHGDEAASSACPCCAHCVTMCATGVMAIPANSWDIAYVSDGALNVRAESFGAGPAPHSLFRPPIAND